MQLRAGLLGGTLLVQSEPGKGTDLSLSIDINPNPATGDDSNY
jgi:signal transduction histidine kinase